MVDDYDDTEYQIDDDTVDDADLDAAQNMSDEEDYHAASSETDSGPSISEPLTQVKPSKLKKIIIFIIILLILLAVGYKLFTVVFNPTKEKPIQPKVTIGTVEETTMKQIPPAMEAQVKKAVPQESVAKDEQKTSVETSMQAEQKKVQQFEDANQKMITGIQSQLSQNQANLSDLQQQVSGLKNSVGDLQVSIDELTTQMKHEQAVKRAAARYRARVYKSKAKRIRLEKRYFVTAVIPGRVWLKAADGTTMTATVGDSISGYGKVTAIDAYSGAVSTSSGVKINYGVNN